MIDEESSEMWTLCGASHLRPNWLTSFANITQIPGGI